MPPSIFNRGSPPYTVIACAMEQHSVPVCRGGGPVSESHPRPPGGTSSGGEVKRRNEQCLESDGAVETKRGRGWGVPSLVVVVVTGLARAGTVSEAGTEWKYGLTGGVTEPWSVVSKAGRTAARASPSRCPCLCFRLWAVGPPRC